ncbi:hypothetical protein EIP91_003742 [Steccherinum ochraceum]|uniref:MYND-type domain-containing protein n=1 Tax=Steccherinum ochraceum TaxID=92696 RepID=A0A4R0S080_9APHY|nr:hypothetical protein EIP91_003742 [Steccherinum ochraceum]
MPNTIHDAERKAPSTAFARLFLPDGTPLNFSIQWDAVVAEEPSQITKWIEHLYRRKDPEVSNLLGYLTRAVYTRSASSFWIIRSTDVLGVLVDILLEPIYTPTIHHHQTTEIIGWLSNYMSKYDLPGDKSTTTAYFKHFSDADDHPRRLLNRLIAMLYNENFVGQLGLEVGHLCAEVFGRGPKSLASIDLPAGQRLVPGYLVWFHRQMCTIPPAQLISISSGLVDIVISTFAKLVIAAPDVIRTDISLHAGSHDLMSILAVGSVLAVKAADMSEAIEQTIVFLLNIVQRSLLQPPAQRASQIDYASMYNAVRKALARVWCDTMNDLRAVLLQNTSSRGSAQRLFNEWRDMGRLFSFRENINVFVTQKPSDPSNLLRYWKIPKRCFANSCACSVVSPALHSHFRACKGCWRVLYCNANCQKA